MTRRQYEEKTGKNVVKEENFLLQKRELKKIETDVILGKGKIFGKGVFANRDFRKGEMVIQYHLRALTKEEFQQVSKQEKYFTHKHNGTIQLYSEPERYVNHSENPNTYQDLVKKCDIALHNIKKGEAITTDATKDDCTT